MSGWSAADKFMEENTNSDFPAINNITTYGYLPSDQIPAPSKLTSIANSLNLLVLQLNQEH